MSNFAQKVLLRGLVPVQYLIETNYWPNLLVHEFFKWIWLFWWKKRPTTETFEICINSIKFFWNCLFSFACPTISRDRLRFEIMGAEYWWNFSLANNFLLQWIKMTFSSKLWDEYPAVYLNGKCINAPFLNFPCSVFYTI